MTMTEISQMKETNKTLVMERRGNMMRSSIKRKITSSTQKSKSYATQLKIKDRMSTYTVGSGGYLNK